MSLQRLVVGNNAGGGAGAAIDQSSGVMNVQRVDDPRFDDLANPVLINVPTGPLAAGTYHYPDANGVSQLGYKPLSFGGRLTAGATDEVTFQVWAWNAFQWIDVTKIFTDDQGVSPISAAIQAANGTVDFAISIDHYPYAKWRATLVVTGGTANTATVGSYQKPI